MDFISKITSDDCSTDDDDDLSHSIMPPPSLLLDDGGEEDEDSEYVLQVIGNVTHLVKRVHRVKVVNYIEVSKKYLDDDFITHFRLCRTTAYQLVDRFENSVQFQLLIDTPGKEVLTAERHILTFLWYAGHETSSYRDVADRFAITVSTLFEVINRVTKFLLCIGQSIIQFPTPEEREIITEKFRKLSGMRGIIGSLDGTHIRIDRPSYDADSYINRKQYFSFQLQGLVDADGNFIHIFLGYPGSVHDARVFRESDLFNKLEHLCGNGQFIIADSAYPCLTGVIVPYKDNGHLSIANRIFNRKLSSARIVVEHAFGRLKQRFRQLYHLKLRDFPRMIQFVHACCVLHNIASADDLSVLGPLTPDDSGLDAGYMVQSDSFEPENGNVLRDELCRVVAACRS